MMRISLESPALIAVRNWLAGSQPTQRGRNGSRKASRLTFRAEQLEKRATRAILGTSVKQHAQRPSDAILIPRTARYRNAAPSGATRELRA